MPQLKGIVTKLIKKRDGTVFGFETAKGEFLYSWPDKREEPFESDKVKVGSAVEGVWMPFEKDDGKTVRYLSTLEVAGIDVAPDIPWEGDHPDDRQFRSPLDFRRTSALAQAVTRHAGAIGPGRADDEDVILTAIRFETYLREGE